MSKGLWRLVKEDEKEPVAVDDSKPTEAERKARADWQDRALKAAGELYLALSDVQKTHLGTTLSRSGQSSPLCTSKRSLERALTLGSHSSPSRCVLRSPCPTS